jgi:transcriptional regulator with XRE-family HTH domain
MARPKGADRPSRKYKESPEFIEARKGLGERIRALRLARRLTLEAAAERMELDFKHLQKVEAGQGNVTLVTLVRLAKGLEVPLEALFERDPAEARASGQAYALSKPTLARVADSDDPAQRDEPERPDGRERP